MWTVEHGIWLMWYITYYDNDTSKPISKECVLVPPKNLLNFFFIVIVWSKGISNWILVELQELHEPRTVSWCHCPRSHERCAARDSPAQVFSAPTQSMINHYNIIGKDYIVTTSSPQIVMAATSELSKEQGRWSQLQHEDLHTERKRERWVWWSIQMCIAGKDDTNQIPFEDGLVWSEERCNSASSSKSKEEKHTSKKLRMQIFGLGLLLLQHHTWTQHNFYAMQQPSKFWWSCSWSLQHH